MRQRVLYAGKYKCHVLKFQAVVDNSGNYLWFSGPHVGSEADGNLWKRRRPSFLTSRERLLGDKAYCGAVFERRLHVIPPFKKPRGGERTQAQSAFNYLHSFHRVKCEHAFGFLKRFGILSQRYRGCVDSTGVRKVHAIMKVLMHLSQFKKNSEPYRNASDCLA